MSDINIDAQCSAAPTPACQFSSSGVKQRRQDQAGVKRAAVGTSTGDRQTGQGAGLTSALLQLDTVAHVDVVDPDVASGRVIEESLEHHLDTRHSEVKAAAR